ncbi:hypothetical protein [Massilia sp. NR 4-1]|uniref:hypothetical protein n=1 Tax=Massilia sp. NR 4-1 TaxID=1678028 RepID=UPI00067B1C89|nr:hypothetical protein [Massilia sp. NR 4-1]AKU21206.1 hypothetical protein ACZ75_06655 [Massilia sp. NR 4-1]
MEQHTAQSDPPGQADIFDMEGHHKAQYGQSQLPPLDSEASTGHKPGIRVALVDLFLKLSPLHLAMITAVIICIGLGWSKLTAHGPTKPGADSQLLSTDAQQLAAPPVTETLSAAPPRSEQASTHQGQVQQPAAPAGESERAIIRAALEDLNARVSRLEAEASHTSASAATLANQPAKAEPQRIAKAQATKKTYSIARSDVLPVLAGYSLNTIYQNQAWIEHDGATYAVQVGDKIGALAITGIDPRARRVVTPNGQIR